MLKNLIFVFIIILVFLIVQYTSNTTMKEGLKGFMDDETWGDDIIEEAKVRTIEKLPYGIPDLWADFKNPFSLDSIPIESNMDYIYNPVWAPPSNNDEVILNYGEGIKIAEPTDDFDGKISTKNISSQLNYDGNEYKYKYKNDIDFKTSFEIPKKDASSYKYKK